jgi:DNA-directed RNA polymerase
MKKGGDRESSIIDSHWSSLQASTTSSASSGLPLCPSSATAAPLLPPRTRVDETLDAALYGLVNLPWLFLQSFSGQDSINPSYPVSSSNSSKAHAVAGLDYNRAFVSVAEAVEDDDETEGELETDVPFSKEGKRSNTPALDEAKRLRKKQYELRKRQLKVETEAWQKAAENYKELMLEMCRKNLAPNLPFAQSLLLGWFEPLRDAIQQEQKEFENLEFREHRSTYGPFMAQLPADMLAVITMHRLMGLLMSDQEHGCVKVLIAALQIGEAVEQEVSIFKLMNSKKKYKKKKKKDLKAAGHINTSETLSQPETTVEDEIKSTKLQKKIQKLVKQQKLRLVGSILRQASSEEAWGPAIHAKVGSRLLELMLETAFVRPPADQNDHDVTELQPAFKHTQKNYPLKSSVNRIYGVIECDPLVLREVDKSVRHMVMPYMPMLVKPKPWKG